MFFYDKIIRCRMTRVFYGAVKVFLKINLALIAFVYNMSLDLFNIKFVPHKQHSDCLRSHG